MQTLNGDLKERCFKQVYLLFGEETYLIRSYKKKLREGIMAPSEDSGSMMGMMGMMDPGGDDSMNYTYMEGKANNLADVRDLAQSMPFFAERRLIVLENTGIFKNASNGWDELLTSLPETTYMIFVESEVDKRNKMYKLVSKNWYAAELAHPSAAMLESWAMKFLRSKDAQIEPEALSLFVQKCSDSMERMQTELTKLADYAMDHSPITAADVEQIVTPQLANRIFDMIEAMTVGNENRALDLYYDLVALKEEPMRIYFLIAKHFNQLLMIKNLMMKGQNQSAIASGMKLNPYVVGKLMRQAKGFSSDQLQAYLELCVGSDEAIKTGNLDPRISVELLIVTIARRKTA